MNTMEITKIFGALCGALLIFLLIRLAGEGLYHTDHGAQAFVIEVAEADDAAGAADEDIDFVQLIADADASAGETVFRRCSACHVMEAGENRAGPYLYGVVGRDIAAAEGFGFSAALQGIDGVWDYEALYGFLLNPREWAPGTTMNFAGLSSQADRANVIAYLEEHGGGS
jgi:cytochrome c